MTNVLITGVSGQDGSYLAELLLEKGYTVYGLERRTSAPLRRTDGVAIIEGDITDAESVAAAVRASQPAEVYNLAAQSFVGTSFTCPAATFDVNATGAVNVFEACLRYAPKSRVYQASTSEMFGLASGQLNERSPFHPRSPYGVSKVAAHYAAQHYRERGLAVSCGILFNHESPRRGEQFLTRKVTRYLGRVMAGHTKKPLQLGDLTPKRDWGYAGDYVKAMWAMVQAPADDFVVASGRSVSVGDFVREAFAYAKVDFETHVEVVPEETRPTEVPALWGDYSKARTTFGWEPTVGLSELVRMMVDADYALAMRNNLADWWGA
jgi:GDPmannose 4,6-dehydratase